MRKSDISKKSIQEEFREQVETIIPIWKQIQPMSLRNENYIYFWMNIKIPNYRLCSANVTYQT